ncbi:MAG: hypothetical protein AAFV80_16670 [Bacteroidota bacterium]
MKAIELLHESYDRELNPKEAQKLQEALANDPALAREKQQLDQLRSLLANQTTRLKASVADDVIKALENESEDLSEGLVRWFPRVAAACLLIILAMLIQIYAQNGSLNSDSLMGIQELELYDAYSLTIEELE